MRPFLPAMIVSRARRKNSANRNQDGSPHSERTPASNLLAMYRVLDNQREVTLIILIRVLGLKRWTTRTRTRTNALSYVDKLLSKGPTARDATNDMSLCLRVYLQHFIVRSTSNRSWKMQLNYTSLTLINLHLNIWLIHFIIYL